MTVKKVQFESMDEVNRFLDVTEHFPFCSGSEKGKQNSKWQIHSWSCIHWPWQRDGLLCTCAGACAGDHIQSWFLHEVGLRGEKINNG